MRRVPDRIADDPVAGRAAVGPDDASLRGYLRGDGLVAGDVARPASGNDRTASAFRAPQVSRCS